MAVIQSDSVQKLRAKTGAGIMDCKRALEKSAGDMEKAVLVLREQGAASAAKRAGRATGDGLVTAEIDPAGKTAVLMELNCETDFVARTDDFQSLLTGLARAAAAAAPAWKSPADAPVEKVKEASAKLGENISLRRFARYDRTSPGVFSFYIHPTGSFGKVGVLLELGGADEKISSREEAKTLGRELAMQVAAASPRWVSTQDVPAATLEQEKSIAREQARRENKPEKIWDKIVEGKVKQFCQQFCLLDQLFVRDPQGKTTVKAHLEKSSAALGGGLTVRRFVRYKVGEEE